MAKLPDLTKLSEKEKDALIITLYKIIEDSHLQFKWQTEEITKLKRNLTKIAGIVASHFQVTPY